MKINCPRDNLMKAVSIVSKAVSSKTSMPILESFLINASSDEIKITANDMEMAIETNIDGLIFEPGKIAIDAKIFSEIVRRLPDNNVDIIKSENETITIICEKSKFSIPGKQPDEFPETPSVTKEYGISLSQFTLKQIKQQTIFSVADNSNNPMMGGEFMDINGNQLKIVSLDGHRVSVRNVELEETYPKQKAIIPGKTLNELSKILSDSVDSKVDIYITKNHILFSFDQTIIVSRVIEGDYFRIDQMLNSDYATKLTINKKEFGSCIDRAALLIRESDKKPLVLSISDDIMEVSLDTPYGSLREDIGIAKTGKDLMIGFNPKFLSDALRVIDEEEVTLYMVNSKAPCTIRDDENKYLYLILPINFNVY